VKTMTMGPPELLETMFSFHLGNTVTKYISFWSIEFEWTEKKIVGHWKLSATPLDHGDRYGFNRIIVVELP
jgi:hypothetical protein